MVAVVVAIVKTAGGSTEARAMEVLVGVVVG